MPARAAVLSRLGGLARPVVARSQRVFAHWALDVRDYTRKGEREVGFIPRPLKIPRDRLLMTPETSVHRGDRP